MDNEKFKELFARYKEAATQWLDANRENQKIRSLDRDLFIENLENDRGVVYRMLTADYSFLRHLWLQEAMVPFGQGTVESFNPKEETTNVSEKTIWPRSDFQAAMEQNSKAEEAEEGRGSDPLRLLRQ